MHYELLVHAELLDLKGDRVEALSKYNAAIEKASRGGWIKDEATAEQKLAEHYFRNAEMEEGHWHLTKSVALYEQWGAHGKVYQLRKKFHEFRLSDTSHDTTFELQRSTG